MNARPIIIDTDPGQDDAFAILLALSSPELDVLGISAVAGNVSVDKAEINARKICDLAGRSGIPVFRGCDRPLKRDLRTAEHIHGESGLDGADLPAPKTPLQPKHAVDWIVETVMAAPEGTITLCPLGPLTNIASAFAREPELPARLKEIVLMGGGFFQGGNITPAAEFNIYVDPHAADIVFRAGVRITMMPLDVTHRALIPVDWPEKLKDMGNRTGAAGAGLIEFYQRYDLERYGETGGPLHDPCVIAWLVEPDIFKGRECNVRIETGSEMTMGMTVVDWWNATKLPATATVINRLDAPRFFDLMLERFRTLP
ncbi:nucleoside hydrolase [Fodinicurvata sp. EGI_FJ10296]|uniref:nucleoside hydrolase n=1 Tax=Fodinicurvata sp. EGI_FJ10296 TaxID=3231908 RepID=UPI00345674D9